MNLLGTRRVRVPRELEGIRVRADAEEATPAAAGLSDDAAARIWQAVEALYRSAAYPAVSFCLRRRGQVVLNGSIGHAEGNGPGDPPAVRKRVMRPDTPVCAFSASKAIIAVLIHKLAEEGGVDLDARVSRYIPRFAASGKQDTTIAQVLAHRGGFPMFELPGEEVEPAMLLDWERCIDLICRAPPSHGARPRMAYHAITGGYILGEILQRVTGRSVKAYLDAKIRRPMHMRSFTYGLPKRLRKDVALNYVAGFPVRYPFSRIAERALMVPIDRAIQISNTALFYDAVIPSANLYTTAEELSRFFQMLLDGGSYGGRQILKPETVARAVRPATRLALDHTLKFPMRYSEGFMLGADPAGLYGPMSGRAFGHIGLMNIVGWADPQRDISAGLLVTGKAILGAHLIPWARLIATVAWQCR